MTMSRRPSPCRQIGDGGHTVSVGYAVLVSACVFAECRVQSVDVANHTRVDSSVPPYLVHNTYSTFPS